MCVIVINENKVMVPISEIGIYPALMVSREDFESRGHDISHVPNNKLTHAAEKIGDIMTEELYWDLIDKMAERFK